MKPKEATTIMDMSNEFSDLWISASKATLYGSTVLSMRLSFHAISDVCYVRMDKFLFCKGFVY